MSNRSKKWILLLGACVLCSAPLYATITESTNTRGEKPSVTQPQAKPETKPTPAPTPGQSTKPAPAPTPGESTKPAPAPTPGESTKPAPAPTPGESTKPAPAPTPGESTKPAPAPTPGQSTKPMPAPTPGESTKPAPAPTPGQCTKPTPAPTPGQCTKPTPAPTPGQNTKPMPAPTPNCKQTGYYKAFEKAMAGYEETTSKLQPSGFVDIDFLEEMIPHHELGISMAENILKTAKNDEVKAIATSIVESQKAQVGQMTKLEEKLKTKNCKCDKNNSCANEEEAKYLAKYKEINESMIKKMKALVATCNDDADFIAEMIPHHEGAVEMAQNILEYSHNRAVKKIAKNIVKEQQAQIKQMQTLLATLQK
ncbi:DUF305 domain-containing protein [Niameybacter massiliensis]|uniref:DUF305 domain-containing protein n=1 Tax=Niameybacter massiliensis TaxID=1658108 RepID=UPI0006B46E70|nr:DUF305 domain-containing protein [Niameybacter massiliensis]